ncbi:family 43 glycosylhydrolase [uncultured Cellulomonas sp.]|uniref:family 43 glycosylhydrolase n=1 Tax=uncultured Cellulomonas sp. TaxID=189682 RepID=UPI0026065449|nr:family 43 glycosylhydrolase [uncultured Cellulomonas sp.]
MPRPSLPGRGLASLAVLALGLTLTGSPAMADTDPLPVEPGQLALTGDLSVHDPTMVYDPTSGLYVVASTHNSIRTAPTMNGPWTDVGSVARADWTTSVPNSTTLWAPDLERIGDTFYYYYSQSSFGSLNSAIGVKTTTTPADPSSYVDLGRPVVGSGILGPDDPALEINAIDPELVQDADGTWWMAWGSFRDGIAIQQLGPDLVSLVGEPTLLASRLADDNPIEGASVFHRDGYYYLIASWDRCCAGAASTYKVVVGRSTSVTGPYVDQNGVRMDEGGGTVILDTRESGPGVTPAGLYRAPGHPDVYTEDGVDYLVYHAYLPANTLGIRPMEWRDGWPSFTESGEGSYDLTDGSYVRLRSEAKSFTPPEIERVAGPTPAFGGAVQLNGGSPVAYVDMPDGIVSEIDGDFTISMWVKRGTTRGNDWARLFDFGDSTDNFMFLTPASAATPRGLRLDIATPTQGGATVPGTGDSVQIPTEWTHVAVSASGSTATLWVDGRPVATNPDVTLRPADLGFTQNNWIGRSQFSADPGLDAAVDDFNIFSRALTPTEMLALTTAPGGGSEIGGGDVAWYRFDEAQGGTQVTDSSPAGNTATAVVPVTSEDELQNPVPGDQCLTAGADGVVQTTCVDGEDSQTWRLDHADGGLYRLVGQAAGGEQCLALADDSGDVGTAVTLAPCGSDVLAVWSIEDTGHGFLRLSNPATDLAVEIANEDGVIGSDVVGAVRAIRPIANMDPPQQWLLEHVAAPDPVAPQFVDVQPGHVFYDDIRWLAQTGLSNGTVVGGQVFYHPTTAMSRQAMAAFMYRYAGTDWTPEPGTPSFTDVGPDHPFYVEIEWMKAQGLADGYEDGSFGATRPVSRQAMAAFLHRAAGEPAADGAPTFTDVGPGHPFATAIAWLQGAGVSEGYRDGTFAPERSISRQAMAAFLHRFDALDLAG